MIENLVVFAIVIFVDAFVLKNPAGDNIWTGPFYSPQ